MKYIDSILYTFTNSMNTSGQLLNLLVSVDHLNLVECNWLSIKCPIGSRSRAPEAIKLLDYRTSYSIKLHMIS